VTGASVFALTAWLVLGGIRLGPGLTDLFVRPCRHAAPAAGHRLARNGRVIRYFVVR